MPLIAVLALLALLAAVSDRYTLVLLTDILVFALFAVSLHFIMGPGGMHSFGHAAYFGLGAYGGALRAAPRGIALRRSTESEVSGVAERMHGGRDDELVANSTAIRISTSRRI